MRASACLCFSARSPALTPPLACRRRSGSARASGSVGYWSSATTDRSVPRPAREAARAPGAAGANGRRDRRSCRPCPIRSTWNSSCQISATTRSISLAGATYGADARAAAPRGARRLPASPPAARTGSRRATTSGSPASSRARHEAVEHRSSSACDAEHVRLAEQLGRARRPASPRASRDSSSPRAPPTARRRPPPARARPRPRVVLEDDEAVEEPKPPRNAGPLLDVRE